MRSQLHFYLQPKKYPCKNNGVPIRKKISLTEINSLLPNVKRKNGHNDDDDGSDYPNDTIKKNKSKVVDDYSLIKRTSSLPNDENVRSDENENDDYANDSIEKNKSKASCYDSSAEIDDIIKKLS